jgi:riboflavin transporter FmnP
MEHQDSVTCPFFGIVAAYSVFVIGCSIYFHDAQVLLWGFGMLLAAAVAWGMLVVLNVVMFLPLFRLFGGLTQKHDTTKSDGGHDEAV